MKSITAALPLLLKAGCPCRYPRFVRLVGFNFQDYNVGPVLCGDTEELVSASIQGPSAFLDLQSEEHVQDSTHRKYRCSRCGASWLYVFTDYSISLSRVYLQLLISSADNMGAEPQEPIPISTGLGGFKKVDLESFGKHFKKMDVSECINYLTAVR